MDSYFPYDFLSTFIFFILEFGNENIFKSRRVYT